MKSNLPTEQGRTPDQKYNSGCAYQFIGCIIAFAIAFTCYMNDVSLKMNPTIKTILIILVILICILLLLNGGRNLRKMNDNWEKINRR